MPSTFTRFSIKMVQDRPALVADLLVGPLGIGVPAFESARLSAGELTDVAPTEYRADAVVTLNVADRPVFAVVVEVQLSANARKRHDGRRTWRRCTRGSRCPAMLLVLCPDPAVAGWCAQPIVVSDPGLALTPVVLGPAQVPVVTDIAVARRIRSWWFSRPWRTAASPTPPCSLRWPRRSTSSILITRACTLTW